MYSEILLLETGRFIRSPIERN